MSARQAQTIANLRERITAMEGSDLPPKRADAIRPLIALVAEEFGVPAQEILAHRRLAPVVLPRHVVMALSRRLTPYSLPQIGRLIGGRDHSTIMHGVRRIERLCKADAAFAERVERLAERFQQTRRSA